MTNAKRITTTDKHADVIPCRITEFLKQRIEALPGNQFVQAWECIEEIDAALRKAGAVAPLAMKYCREVRAESTAKLSAVV